MRARLPITRPADCREALHPWLPAQSHANRIVYTALCQAGMAERSPWVRWCSGLACLLLVSLPGAVDGKMPSVRLVGAPLACLRLFPTKLHRGVYYNVKLIISGYKTMWHPIYVLLSLPRSTASM